MKKLAIFLILAAGLLYFNPFHILTSEISPPTSNFSPPSETNPPEFIDRDDLAGFGIYTNGIFRVFTNSRYYNKSDEIYVEPKNPYVIHIKKTGSTWNDFFSTLPMEVTEECLTVGTGEKFCNGSKGTLKFYINGEKVEDFLERVIEDGDRALITFGKDSEEQIKKQMESVVNPLP